MKINKIKERRKQKAICSRCFSPDYTYLGKPFLKHEFKCNSCGNIWQYGNTDSHYLRLK